MSTPTINTKIKLDGEKEYKDALAQINASLRTLDSELGLTEAQFGDNADSVDALTAKNKILNQQISAQMDKVKELESALQHSSETYGENDTHTQKWQTSLNKAKTELIGMEKALYSNTEQLDDAGQEVDNFSGGLDDLAQKTGVATDGFDDAFDALKKTKGGLTETGGAMDDTANSSVDLGNAVDSVADKFGFSLPDGLKKGLDSLGKVDAKAVAIAGSLAAAATAVIELEKKMASMTLESASAADNIQTLAMQTGLTTDQIQELQYASELIDVDFDTISGSLTKLTNKMQDAQAGNKDLRAEFDKLGVSVVDQATGSLRSAQDVFFDTIDALGKIENSTERDAIAMDLMGKSAQDLNPLIIQGSDKLKQYAQEAHSVGYVMDKDMLGSLGAVDDAYQRMQLSQEAARNQLSVKFAPALEAFYTSLSKHLGQLSTDTADSGIVKFLGSVLELATDLIPVMDGVGDMLTMLSPMIKMAGVQLSFVADVLRLITDVARAPMALISAIFGNSSSLENIGSDFSNFFSGNTATGRYLFNASGSDNYPGGVTWVGEAGPERVWLPSGSRIATAQESRGSGGDTYYVTIDAKSVKEFDDITRIAQNQRRASRMGVNR